MGDTRFVIYRNPVWPPLSNEINLQLHGHDPGFLRGYTFREPVVEYLLQHLTFDPSWPQVVKEWHAAITGWIPLAVFDWWQRQFQENVALSPMPRAWWLYRARSMVVAEDAQGPIGAVALTHVYGGDRSKYLPQREPLFNEMRGLVVKSGYRTAKVGTRLVEAIVQEAYRLGQVATFAITTNPAAVRIFATTGATETCPQHQVADYAIRSLLCWESPMPGKPLCADCPQRRGQLWWWPTHLAAPDGS